jgi:hypothetical protein
MTFQKTANLQFIDEGNVVLLPVNFFVYYCRTERDISYTK